LSASNNAANAGIGAILGFEFQRNCALYLLLNDYDSFKNREFFLCIEHHDDFLFCYRTSCLSEIEQVHSYQAKKLSGSSWTINKRFCEMIAKMLQVGNNLKNDPATKCSSYSHELTFISNTDIHLSYTPTSKEKKNGKKAVTHQLNEQNEISKYHDLPLEVQIKIDEKVDSYSKKEKIDFHKDEQSNLCFQWVDLPRNAKVQNAVLVGIMSRQFSHIPDPQAAVDVLISLFREVETIYNQGKEIKLLDTTKRVEGNEIKKAFNVIGTEQKTYDLWREYSAILSHSFNITLHIQKNHETHIKSTFELLKDMNNKEHQKIKIFVREKN
jgi:hypothetical protein